MIDGVGYRRQRIAGLEHRLRPRGERFVGGHLPAERVGESVDHVEESGNVNRVYERLLGHAGGEDGYGICWCQFTRSQCELLEEPERRAQALVDWRRPPVQPDRLPDLVTERIRRDRAVRPRSEGALVERGDEAGEELPLTDGPVGRAAHCEVERIGERAPEQLRPIVKSLQHVGWLRAALHTDVLEHLCL